MGKDKPKPRNSKKRVLYPFMHSEGKVGYVPANNKYMQEAEQVARLHSLDKTVPTGSVIVIGSKIIGRGANGSDYHEKNGCERVRLNIPTGQNYELCEGCSPKNHSEPQAIKDVLDHGQNTVGAELYLWGHWWCCETCWEAMVKNGIAQVFLLENSDQLFNKLSPKNIIGKQFAKKTIRI